MEVNFNVSAVKDIKLSEIVSFTNDRITNMEECADFIPEPDPSIENMRARCDLFSTRQSTYKANPSELNKQLRNEAYDELINGHISWMDQGKKLCAGDINKALRLGYPLFATRTKAVIPEGKPLKPTFDLTPNPGEVVLKATPYKQESKTIYYNWQMSEDGVTYQYLPTFGSSYRRRIVLEFHKTYYFKVAYATSAGEGPWSDTLEITLTPDMVGKPKRKKKSNND